MKQKYTQVLQVHCILYRYTLSLALAHSIYTVHNSQHLCFRRRSAKKGKNGYKDGKHLYRHEDSISETNPNYNFPLYERNMQGYTAKPAIMYMNPVGDQDVRDYYMDRSTAPTSRYSS